MAHKTIRIDEKAYNLVQEASRLYQRSVSGQIAHWLNIGRVVEQSPDFDMERVERALKAEIALDDLTPEEAAVFHEEFFSSMGEITKESEDFYAGLAAEAEAVGYTETS